MPQFPPLLQVAVPTPSVPTPNPLSLCFFVGNNRSPMDISKTWPLKLQKD